jgi:aminopeptidase N
MSHDPDPFTRWEAGQVAARGLILREAAAPGQAFAPLIAGLRRALDRAPADPAFAALALRLPDLTQLIQASSTPDVDALDEARHRLKAAVAKALEPDLRRIAETTPLGSFSADAAAAGARALRITALDLLSALGAEAADLIADVFATADNMTVQINALEALGHSGSAAWQGALDRFYAQWHQTPLALDKWFSAQAASSRADVLSRLAFLRQSSDFTLSNPNRIRALAAAFPARNPRAFHAADGTGYRFLADLVADIDPLNPALAARLLTGFESWRRFDLGRQSHARAALEGLRNRPTVSKNSGEMLGRMLS